MSKEKKSNKIRINKYLSQWGAVSRRKADQLIQKGQVSINGHKLKSPGILVDPQQDTVKIKNKKINAGTFSPVYMMFNKPEKVLTTMEDPKGRPIVMDYIKRGKSRLFPVGRLDWNSEGLLLLTNDGNFSQEVLHPKKQIAKTYLAKIQGKVPFSSLNRLLKGVTTPFGKRKALYVEKLSRPVSNSEWIKVIIAEGKNRQIRLMFQAVGFQISVLRRTAVGQLKMNKLKKGFFKRLTAKEAEKVFLLPKELAFARSRKKLSKTR